MMQDDKKLSKYIHGWISQSHHASEYAHLSGQEYGDTVRKCLRISEKYDSRFI